MSKREMTESTVLELGPETETAKQVKFETPPPKNREKERNNNSSPLTELERVRETPLLEVVKRFLRTLNIFTPIDQRRIPDPLDEFKEEHIKGYRVRYSHLKLGKHLRHPEKKDATGEMVKDRRSPFENWNAVEYLSFFELNADLIAHRFLYLYQAEILRLQCSGQIREFLFARSLRRAVMRDRNMLHEDQQDRLGMRIVKGILRHLIAPRGAAVSFADTAFRPINTPTDTPNWRMEKRSYELMIFNPGKEETIEPNLLPGAPTRLEFPAYPPSSP